MDTNTFSKNTFTKRHSTEETASTTRDAFEEFLTNIGLREESKLSVMDFRRIITFQPSYESNVLRSIEEIVYRWLRRISEHDNKASILLCEELDRYQKEGKNNTGFSGRDVLFAIWKCCDPFLRQDITRKSIACKTPVPVLSPDHKVNKITFHLFGLRKSAILMNDTGKNSQERINVTTNPFVHISVLQFGNICHSKCQILNNLLATLSGDNADCFISRSEDTKHSIWSKGTVEGAWCSPVKNKDFPNDTRPVGLFVLRGDALKYKVQTKFCLLTSNVLLIFTNYQNATKASHTLQKIKPDSKVIFVVFPNESGTTGDLKIELSYEVLEINQSTPSEVSQFLYQSLRKILCGISITQNNTLERSVDVCNMLNITIDESHKECPRAKQLVNDIVNTVKGAVQKNQEIFVLQKSSQEFQPPDDKVVKTDGSELEKSSLQGASCELLLKLQGNASLSESMIKFLNGVTSSDDEYFVTWGEYFFTWLHFFLDREFLSRQCSFERTLNRNDTNHRQSGERLRTEHFLRELELMFECSHPYLKKEEHCLEKIIAKTLLHGFSFEIINDDMNSLPGMLVERVFHQLHLLLQHNVQILTVSILGSSRSSNRSLLNQLFGVKFTAEGNYPNGLQVQFVDVHVTQTETEKQILIIAESDTFNICTKSNTSCLIPAVFCLSDLIIFNITEEEDSSDIGWLCKIGVSSLLLTEEIRKMFSVDCTRRDFPVCCAVKHCKESGNFLKDLYSKQVLSKLEGAAEDMMSFALIDQGREQEVFTNIINSFAHNYRYNNHEENIYCFTLRKSQTKLHPTDQYLSDLGHIRLHLAHVLAKLPPSNLVEFSKGIKEIKKEGNVMRSFYRLRQKIHDNFMKKVQSMNVMRLTSSIEDGIKMSNTSMAKKVLDYAPFLTLKQREELDDLSPLTVENLNISEEMNREIHLKKTLLARSKREFHAEYFYQDLLTRLITVCENCNYPDIVISQKVTASKLLGRLKSTQVNDVFPDMKLSSCAVPPTQIESKSEIYEYATKIFKGTESVANKIEKLDKTLHDMSLNHQRFEQNVQNVTVLINSFVNEVADITSIEPGSTYLFLLSKYLYNTNRSQLDSEVSPSAKSTLYTEKMLSRAVNYDVTETSTIITGQTSHEMTQADPLKFPDLNTKISYAVANLKQHIPESERLVLQEFLTPEDVEKYSRVPVNVLTFQVMDRYLFRLLPKLSKNDVNVLSCLIRDVKVTVMGKILAMKALKCDQIFDEILEATKNAPISQQNKKRQRAAVLSHLVAWASYFIAVRELEENKKEFVALVLNTSKTAESMLLQKQLQSKEDELVVRRLCNVFRRNLHEIIEIGLLSRLTEFMRTKNLFQRKLNFIGTVLRSLLDASEWAGFIKFLKNFDNFSNNWILTFLASECNKRDDSLIQNLLQTTVNTVVTKAINDVQTVKENAKSMTEFNSRGRIDKLCKLFMEHCSTYCEKSDLTPLQGISSVECFIALLTKFINELKTLKEELIQSFQMPTEGNLHSTKLWLLRLPGDLHKDLYEAVKGCVRQCPFCGVVCDHEKEQTHGHIVAHHAPTGLKGNNFDMYHGLQWRVCEHLVSHAINKYRSHGVENLFRNYKENFPKWKIDPNSKVEPSKFWKYVFVHFNKQFAEFYECKEGFPEQWRDVSREDALQSLKDLYKLN